MAKINESRRASVLLFALLIPALAGCVQADFEIVLFPDGSGALHADVAYSSKKWPAFFGDPYASFTTPAGFAGMMPPGFVAWAEPRIRAEDGWRHLRTAAYFDDIRRVIFPAKRQGRHYAALRFAGDPVSGELHLVSQLDSILARPVPLPSPDELGMDGVSIPDAVMDGIRSQLGTLLAGLDLRLTLVAPGKVTRADGFDRVVDGRAVIEVDAQRGAAAFQDRASVLVDAPRLLSGDARWVWVPAEVDPLERTLHRADRMAALNWFGVEDAAAD